MIDCIKKIAMQIVEELMDSQKYIDLATKMKEDYPRLADLYRDLSAEELAHAERLHEAGTDLVKADDEEDAESAKIIWDWETERMGRWEQNIKVLHEMYAK